MDFNVQTRELLIRVFDHEASDLYNEVLCRHLGLNMNPEVKEVVLRSTNTFKPFSTLLCGADQIRENVIATDLEDRKEFESDMNDVFERSTVLWADMDSLRCLKFDPCFLLSFDAQRQSWRHSMFAYE